MIVDYAQTEVIITALRRGDVVVLATDTLYGIVAQASNATAVANVHKAKQRSPQKACIVLIDSPESAYGNDTQKLQEAYRALDATTPTSVIIDHSDAPNHLLEADGSVAYRIPQHKALLHVLRQTGPLIAPSANLEGEPPAATISEAVEYFGSQVAVYVDAGVINPKQIAPSKVVRVVDGKLEYLR